MGNDIYIGGVFTISGSTSIASIVKWDGNQWSEVGRGVNGLVYALETDGINLYVGGGVDQGSNFIQQFMQ